MMEADAYAPLKRRSSSTRLHGAVSQKAVVILGVSCFSSEGTCILYRQSVVSRTVNVDALKRPLTVYSSVRNQ
jgi:hypothetical protein